MSVAPRAEPKALANVLIGCRFAASRAPYTHADNHARPGRIRFLTNWLHGLSFTPLTAVRLPILGSFCALDLGGDVRTEKAYLE